MVECPLDVLRWADESYRVENWCALSSPLFPKSKANADKWTATLEFKAILAMLVRSLEFRDTAAVVQQKNAPVSSLLRMGKRVCYRWALRLREGDREQILLYFCLGCCSAMTFVPTCFLISKLRVTA